MKKTGRKILSTLIAVFMLCALLPTTALAAEKDLTVGAGETYTTIQDAINYIAKQEDKTDWTIEVKAGTYERFAVLDGLDDLIVKATDGEVVVEAVNNSTPPFTTGGGAPDPAGISIRNADHVTLDGLTIRCGTQTVPWYAAGVSTYTESSLKGDAPVLKNCVLEGSGNGIGLFINSGTTQFTVENCTFSNFKEAVGMYGDSTLMQGASITGSTFTNCSFALHGYYGGNGDAGILLFANNTVTGTDALRSKIVIQDQTNTGAIKADVRDNVLTNAVVGLVNLGEDGETVSDVLKRNTMGTGSFYVEAIEPGTIEFYADYLAPDGKGHWELTGLEDFEVNWGKNPDGSTAYIQDIIDKANAARSHKLHLTGIDPENLVKTFTWFKDGIYWVTEKVSYPGLEKWIVQEDGTLVKKDSVAKGETVDFLLQSNVPEDLDAYLPDGTYHLTFQDVMDEALILEDGSVEVTVNGKPVKVTPVIGTDIDGKTTMEVELELVALYQDGYFSEEDFGTAPIVLSYSATAAEDIQPGVYYNKAWVEYEGGETEVDIVEVDTYGVSIFKYDQEDRSGLAGAIFELRDGEGHLIATLTSGADGYVSYDGLKDGTYTLTEIKAPSGGYIKSDKPITIVIPDDAGADYIVHVQFANSKVPHTGGSGTGMFAAGGAALTGAACMLYLFSRKREEA